MSPSLLRSGRIAPLFGVLVAMALAVASCGSSPSDNKASAAGTGSKGITLQAAEFTWSAATVTTAILQRIAADHPELGVKAIATKRLDPAPAWAAAQRGDIDLLTEVALPNQQPLADKAKSQVSLLSKTYGGAEQGWFVPSYAVAPGAPLAGLKSVTELGRYKDALGGKLYDADPGWISTQQNTSRLKGYGIDFQHVTSGEAAELAQLQRAYQRKQPIVLYLYHPHWVFARYEMTRLQEGAPYSPTCFTSGGPGNCAMAAYAAWIAAKKDLAQRAPGFDRLLHHFEIQLTDVEAMLRKVDVDKQAASAVAAAWVTANQSKIQSWIG